MSIFFTLPPRSSLRKIFESGIISIESKFRNSIHDDYWIEINLTKLTENQRFRLVNLLSSQIGSSVSTIEDYLKDKQTIKVKP